MYDVIVYSGTVLPALGPFKKISLSGYSTLARIVAVAAASCLPPTLITLNGAITYFGCYVFQPLAARWRIHQMFTPILTPSFIRRLPLRLRELCHPPQS